VISHDNLEAFRDPAHYDLEEVPRSLARLGDRQDCPQASTSFRSVGTLARIDDV
jgi:hypothetical protein